MTAKFGFQVTVQDRTIWFFPEDVNIAEGVAKAEAAVKAAVQTEIDKLKAGDVSSLNQLFSQLPDDVKAEIQYEIDRLKKEAEKSKKTLEDSIAMATALKNKASLVESNLTKITQFSAEAKKQIETLKAKLNTGVSYGWKREAGELPISLGTFEDLLNFVDEKIIKKLGITGFDTSDSFNDMVNGLPSPINDAISDLTTKAIFELDGIRLNIPGKNSKEKIQFEIAMLINLIPLDLELGPFRLNQVYAKFGNFGSVETTS